MSKLLIRLAVLALLAAAVPAHAGAIDELTSSTAALAAVRAATPAEPTDAQTRTLARHIKYLQRAVLRINSLGMAAALKELRTATRLYGEILAK